MCECPTCGQGLPERHVPDFRWWRQNGTEIGYTNAGGYVYVRSGGEDDLSLSPEYAIHVANALKSCAQEVLRRREPLPVAAAMEGEER